MYVHIKLADKNMQRYGGALNKFPQKALNIMSRTLNAEGKKGLTAVRQVLMAETGIKANQVKRAVKETKSVPNFRAGGDAGGRTLTYMIEAAGAETNLALFKAGQRKKGVSAAPWGKRRIFRSTFIIPGYGNLVYQRTSDARGPMRQLWGPNIAREMMKPPSKKAWEGAVQGVAAEVTRQLARELP